MQKLANDMAPQQPLVVLLLEDLALVRAGMRALIEISEPRAIVYEASYYEEALQRLADTPIDVAFLDVDLKAQKSGIDVLCHIRASNLKTRAIMLSGLSDEDLVMKCLRLGASGYIIKEAQSDGLFRTALDTIFEGGVFLPGLPPLAERPGSEESTIAALDQLGVRGRAVEVLYYICQGLPNQMIAFEMGLAESTVANDYNTRLFRQFRVTNRASLIVEVAKRGLALPVPRKLR